MCNSVSPSGIKSFISFALIELNMEFCWFYLPNVNCLVECGRYLSDLEPNANSGYLAYGSGPCNIVINVHGKKKREKNGKNGNEKQKKT